MQTGRSTIPRAVPLTVVLSSALFALPILFLSNRLPPVTLQTNIVLAVGGAIVLGSICIGVSMLAFLLNARDQTDLEAALRRAEDDVMRGKAEAQAVLQKLAEPSAGERRSDADIRGDIGQTRD